MRKVYPLASYLTVNVSSPNTKDLRRLQQADELDGLLRQLKAEQTKLAQEHGRYVPVALKIAPDLTSEQLRAIADLLLTHRIDALVATNTTVSRDGIEGLPNSQEPGGLSGASLTARANHVVREMAKYLHAQIPIIAVGGIMSGTDAADRMASGASLVQLYTGLVYAGPRLVADAARALAARVGDSPTTPGTSPTTDGLQRQTHTA
jgi:dihydroorotate dehydrogenase